MKLNNHGWGMMVFLLLVLIILIIMIMTSVRVEWVENLVQ